MIYPIVKAGDWITIKSGEKDNGIEGCVLEVISEGVISVGYYQNSTRATKETVVWEGTFWKFKYMGLPGLGAKDRGVAIVKRGAPI